MLSQEDSDISEINVTPLVDVMMVLLVIFMVTVPVMRLALPVDLPEETAHTITQTAETVHLSVTKDGKIYWNEQMVSEIELEGLLTQLAKNKEGSLYFNADKLTTYEQITHVLALIEKTGIKRLGFVTRLPKT